MLATHPNLTCSHDEPCNAQCKLLSSFITLYTISLCNLPSPTTKMHSVCFGFLGLFCIDRIEHNIFQLRLCHQHISSIFSQSLPPQKAVCFTSFHVELPHPYSQRSQHSHYTSQRHAKTSTVPECWSDPSGSFLAALVSFKVSSDVEPPAPQVKSVKSGPKASSSSSSAAKSQKCRPGVTNVTKRHASAMHGQCVSGIVRPQKHTEVYFHKPLRYDFIDT